MQQFILNNVNLTIAKKFSQSLFILTFGSLEGLREFEFLGDFDRIARSIVQFLLKIALSVMQFLYFLHI